MRLLVFGAGGHAKVVIDSALAAGWEIAGVVGAPGGASEILGHQVIDEAVGVDADGFIVAAGDNRTRARIFADRLTAGPPPVAVVHPSAVIGSDVSIGAGTLVAPGVVINAGARIGENAILNTGCLVDHDVIVGDHVHVGPGSTLCGAVKIGDGVLLGAGTSIIPVMSVGEWSIVGAGSAVVEDVPPRVVSVGVPARQIRRVEE